MLTGLNRPAGRVWQNHASVWSCVSGGTCCRDVAPAALLRLSDPFRTGRLAHSLQPAPDQASDCGHSRHIASGSGQPFAASSSSLGSMRVQHALWIAALLATHCSLACGARPAAGAPVLLVAGSQVRSLLLWLCGELSINKNPPPTPESANTPTAAGSGGGGGAAATCRTGRPGRQPCSGGPQVRVCAGGGIAEQYYQILGGWEQGPKHCLPSPKSPPAAAAADVPAEVRLPAGCKKLPTFRCRWPLVQVPRSPASPAGARRPGRGGGAEQRGPARGAAAAGIGFRAGL